MKHYGLIGRRLGYSFSKDYFTRKFERKNVDANYVHIELNNLDNLPAIIKENNLTGFNVTIPYKEEIIPYLFRIEPLAKEIGAVNCVSVQDENQWIGYNTDIIGFELSLLNLIKTDRPHALVFGTGGASKAVQFVLRKLEINYQVVSRHAYYETIQYQDLTEELLQKYKLLINTTPVGTFPHVAHCIDIPFEFVGSNHYCFDLIYNPEKTEFLRRGQDQGAKIKNGKEMLELQAEASWKIWQGDAKTNLSKTS